MVDCLKHQSQLGNLENLNLTLAKNAKKWDISGEPPIVNDPEAIGSIVFSMMGNIEQQGRKVICKYN